MTVATITKISRSLFTIITLALSACNDSLLLQWRTALRGRISSLFPDTDTSGTDNPPNSAYAAIYIRPTAARTSQKSGIQMATYLVVLQLPPEDFRRALSSLVWWLGSTYQQGESSGCQLYPGLKPQDDGLHRGPRRRARDRGFFMFPNPVNVRIRSLSDNKSTMIRDLPVEIWQRVYELGTQDCYEDSTHDVKDSRPLCKSCKPYAQNVRFVSPAAYVVATARLFRSLRFDLRRKSDYGKLKLVAKSHVAQQVQIIHFTGRISANEEILESDLAPMDGSDLKLAKTILKAFTDVKSVWVQSLEPDAMKFLREIHDSPEAPEYPRLTVLGIDMNTSGVGECKMDHILPRLSDTDPTSKAKLLFSDQLRRVKEFCLLQNEYARDPRSMLAMTELVQHADGLERLSIKTSSRVVAPSMSISNCLRSLTVGQIRTSPENLVSILQSCKDTLRYLSLTRVTLVHRAYPESVVTNWPNYNPPYITDLATGPTFLVNDGWAKVLDEVGRLPELTHRGHFYGEHLDYLGDRRDWSAYGPMYTFNKADRSAWDSLIGAYAPRFEYRQKKMLRTRLKDVESVPEDERWAQCCWGNRNDEYPWEHYHRCAVNRPWVRGEPWPEPVWWCADHRHNMKTWGYPEGEIVA